MEQDEARRTTGAILLAVAAASALFLLSTFVVDYEPCAGGGPAGCGGMLHGVGALLLRGLAAVLAVGAALAGVRLRRPR